MNNWNRRKFIAASAALTALPGTAFSDESSGMLSKPIPSTGESLPVVGLGTYSVFDVDSTEDAIATRKEIVERLLNHGGSLLDTSPMYNRSERVIGDVIKAGVARSDLFLATKVWTDGRDAGIEQMRRSAELMRARTIDLMQVHNLRDTKIHMQTIREWQDEGRIRFSGLTHYTAGAHEALAREMVAFKPDFIQINYSIGEREAENNVLPMAQDLGIAVLINRPFQAGALFRAVSGKPLPDFAKEFVDSWGQFFLKFIISHPAVTCAIPATSKPHHMTDNLGAGFGTMPDAPTRQRMADYFSSL
ncbi:MAG: aldo/keto reductase [Gammaproteobacteria bacterium]|nr:aldo/keto reductase [Gammaproteobacteria bacterium]